jgi:Family of unknown function (DUF6166)
MACRSIRASTSINSAAWDSSGPTKVTARANFALALLADHLGDPQCALALTGGFARGVVAELDNAWRLTSDERGTTWSATISDITRCADAETMRLRLCRPTLADVPTLFRFLGDRQAMIHPCRRFVAGLPPSDRGARVVPSPGRLCPLDSRPQV